MTSSPPANRRQHGIARVLAFIRFSHTIFALPFALGSLIVAAHGLPGWRLVLLVVLAMIFARTAAMAFNRIADWEIDKRNPRTAGRHTLVSRVVAIELTVASAGALIVTTSFINGLCFALSPVALGIIFFYSLTKRFTAFSHFFLGLALAVSPVGAWLAVRGEFASPPLVLAGAVLLWVAGFDMIYAAQDVEFDRAAKLHSMVVRLGFENSLRLAQGLHAAMFLLLIAFGIAAQLGAAYFAGLAAISTVLIYEHHVARGRDIASVNAAFFNANAWVGAIFLTAVVADRMWPF